jgi:hypothetical protein
MFMHDYKGFDRPQMWDDLRHMSDIAYGRIKLWDDQN